MSTAASTQRVVELFVEYRQREPTRAVEAVEAAKAAGVSTGLKAHNSAVHTVGGRADGYRLELFQLLFRQLSWQTAGSSSK